MRRGLSAAALLVSLALAAAAGAPLLAAQSENQDSLAAKAQAALEASPLTPAGETNAAPPQEAVSR